ncbi:hypothetical protein B0T21DRAFT_354533 [Apiosordaria backusii]|uniref:Uncharacterized protein n=1 Tax=Apiosordaria backusii TaxID=314023 RepID=A0AA40K6B9_9PEZI|nr:hypothetical protein B0T21DRAFT_354533 [Apiosordaria backusii]
MPLPRFLESSWLSRYSCAAASRRLPWLARAPDQDSLPWPSCSDRHRLVLSVLLSVSSTAYLSRVHRGPL